MDKLKYIKNNIEYDLAGERDKFVLTEASGISSITADISTGDMANHDGVQLTGTRLPSREVVLYFTIRKPNDDNRNYLLRVFQAKSEGVLKIEASDLAVKMDGVVERVELKTSGLIQKLQVTLLASDPYLYSVESESENSETRAAAFTFPFSIDSSGTAFGTITRVSAMTLENEGDAPIGIKCTMQATGAVTNPYFWNTSTGEQLKLSATMVDGDEIIINTNSGKKAITKNGTNILGKMTDSSKWVTLDIGTNLVGHSADSGSANLIVTYEFTEKYMAV